MERAFCRRRLLCALILLAVCLGTGRGTLAQTTAEQLADIAGVLAESWPRPLPEPAVRTDAVLDLDTILQVAEANGDPAVIDAFFTRIEEAAADVASIGSSPGMHVWQLYNMAYLVRTPSATVCFDLTRGWTLAVQADPGRANAAAAALVDQCDALLVTHFHADHADAWVADRFLSQGKPVVAPDDVWQDQPFYSQVTHLARVPHVEQSLPVQGGSEVLQMVVYPGHQGAAVINNVYVVYLPEGWTFAHVGDETNYWPDVDPVSGWAPRVSLYHQIDVLVLKSRGVYEILANGFDPGFLLAGHVNEMNHVGSTRLSYLEAYDRLSTQGFPFVMTTWGERYSPFSGRADAGPDQSYARLVSRVRLSASQSIGPITSHLWEQTDGPGTAILDPAAAQTWATLPAWYQDPGPFSLTYRLTVTDENGHSSEDEVTIAVNQGGGFPTR